MGLLIIWYMYNMTLVHVVARKSVFGVANQVRYKPDCTDSKDGQRLEMSDLEGLYCLCSKNKGAEQLRSHCEADLRLCFCIGKKLIFT